MMQYLKYFRSATLMMAFAATLFSCKSKQHPVDERDTPDHGSIHISVDETFRPVIEQEIQMYRFTYPDTRIIADYKPEIDCFKDLQSDATKMIIVARGLDSTECKYYENKLSFVPRFQVAAFDAITVVVNAHSTDSVFSYAALKDILSGKNHNKTVVMDGNKATSTVRYVMDSIMKGTGFGDNVTSAPNSQGVLDAVVGNVNAIGFVGSSWIGNFEDSTDMAYQGTLKTALLECKICKDGLYARPSQETITTMQYPLFRPMVPIVKETGGGLASGFYNFLGSERGQLIFRRSFLMPGQMAFNIRQVNLK